VRWTLALLLALNAAQSLDAQEATPEMVGPSAIAGMGPGSCGSAGV
jgi:hypothetical protein